MKVYHSQQWMTAEASIPVFKSDCTVRTALYTRLPFCQNGSGIF